MSQSDLILAALLRGERLSKLDAFRMGAGLSINSRIADLRKQGWVIPCVVEMRNGKRVWVYHMAGPVQLPLTAFEEAVLREGI